MSQQLLSIAVVCIPLLVGCGSMRMQTKAEAINEINKSAQHTAESQCTKYSSPEYQICLRQVREAYEEQRRKNLENIK